MTQQASKYNILKISKKLRKELDADRYRHTLGVTYTAASLAMCYGEDLEQAQVAGLLHDCAKCIPNEKKIHLCEKYDIPIAKVEYDSPFLLHAKLGADLAKRRYDVEDPAILSAIRYHTTGRPDMTRLEEIIFIADYIEPMRWKAANLEQIRYTAFHDLDKAVYMTLRDTLAYLHGKEESLDETTAAAFAFYEAKVMQQNKQTDEEDD